MDVAAVDYVPTHAADARTLASDSADLFGARETSGTVRVGEHAHPSEHPWPRGTVLGGGYTVERVLGQGGFAVVYEATHPELGLVAIKVLDVTDDNDEATDARFVREARIAAAIEHPNVLQVHELRRAPEGSPFLVMELLMGEDLSDLIARQRLEVEAAVELGIQLALAIEALERAGILHRDLKPQNVLMHYADGGIRPKLIDFGIATSTADSALTNVRKLTRTGVVLGTPHYLSPEQARGEGLDVRADLYALGVVLFEVMCGRAPFEDDNLGALMASVLRDERPPITEFVPECPEGFAAIVAKAILRDREERFQSPAAFREALVAFAETEGLTRGSAAFHGLNLSAKMTLPWELRTLAPCAKRSDERQVSDGHGATTPRPLSLGGLEKGTAERAPKRRGWKTLALSAKKHLAPIAAAAGVVLGFAIAGFMGAESDVDTSGAQLETTAAAAPEVESPTEANDSATEADDGSASAGATESATASADSAELAPEPPAQRAAAATEDQPETAEQPSARALERSAHRAYVRGRLTQARNLYVRATRSDPSLSDAWRGYGLVAARMGRPAEARRALGRYLRLEPNASDASSVRRTLASL